MKYYSVIILALVLLVGCESPEGELFPPTATVTPAVTPVVMPTPVDIEPMRELPPVSPGSLVDLGKSVLKWAAIFGIVAILAFTLMKLAKMIVKFFNDREKEEAPGITLNAQKVKSATERINKELERVDSNVRDIEREAGNLLEGIHALLTQAVGMRALYDLYEQCLNLISEDSIDVIGLAKARGDLSVRDPITANTLKNPHLWTADYRDQIAESLAEQVGLMAGWADQYVEHAAKLQRTLTEYQRMVEQLRFDKNYGANALPVLAMGKSVTDAISATEVIRGLFPQKHRSDNRLMASLFGRKQNRLGPVSKQTRVDLEKIVYQD